MYRLPPPSPYDPRLKGMGDTCCASCAHGGTCDGKKGMGLFDSGMDFTSWGIPEWIIAALGAYMLVSTVFSTGRNIRATGEAVRGYRKRRRVAKGGKLRAKAARLQKRAEELEAT